MTIWAASSNNPLAKGKQAMNSVATLLPFTANRARRVPPARQAPSCVETLYAQVFEDILQGRFTLGLSEDLLMQTYDAGRSHVRRVVTRLVRQRVILARPNQRARVAEPDAEQLRQILLARRMAESSVIERACTRTDDVTLKSLRGLVAQECESITTNRQSTATRLGAEFHLELARIAGNTPLVHFLEELVPLTGLVLMRHPPRTEDWRVRDAIVNAMEKNNAGAAIEEMRNYLDRLATLPWA